MADALDGLDADLVGPPDRDADVAGDLVEIERAVRRNFVGLGEALGLFRPLTGFLVAIQPPRVRGVVVARGAGDGRLGRHGGGQRREENEDGRVSHHGYCRVAEAPRY